MNSLCKFRNPDGPVPRSRQPLDQKKSGFSLVEVVLALGICSFSMMAIVGMIPVGLSTFNDAMNTTVQSQIVQRLAGDVLLTDYSSLTGSAGAPHYYNEQGLPTSQASSDVVYVAVIEQQRLALPAVLSGAETLALTDDPGVTIVIKISRKTAPEQVYSYPVIVANNNQ